MNTFAPFSISLFDSKQLCLIHHHNNNKIREIQSRKSKTVPGLTGAFVSKCRDSLSRGILVLGLSRRFLPESEYNNIYHMQNTYEIVCIAYLKPHLNTTFRQIDLFGYWFSKKNIRIMSLPKVNLNYFKHMMIIFVSHRPSNCWSWPELKRVLLIGSDLSSEMLNKLLQLRRL